MSNDKSYWIQSGLITLMERFSTQLFNLLSIMILFRVLSKEEMGVLAIFAAIFSILEQGKAGLLQNAFVKYLSTAENKIYGKILTASLTLNIITTIFIVALLLLIAQPLSISYDSVELKYLLELYCLTTIALIPFFQFNFTQQANLQFKGIFWSNFIRYGFFFIYVALFAFMSWTIRLTDIVIIRTIGVGIGAVASYIYARPYLKFDATISWKWVATLFNYGKYVMGTNLGTMLHKKTDQIMLGAMLGKAPTAIYEAAIKVTNLAEAPTFSVAAILFPQSARQLKNGKEAIKLLYEKAVGAILAILVPILIFVLFAAEWIIWIVSGPDYLEAANILRLTMFYGLFIPYAVQFGTVLDSTGRAKINFGYTVGAATINIFFNYVCIQQFGIIGAAWGTLFTYIVAFIAMQWYLHRTFDVQAFKPVVYMFVFYKQIIGLLKKKIIKPKSAI